MSKLLTDTQVAPILNVKPSTLRKWRLTGEGPTFRRLGPRIVRYFEDDVKAYLESLPALRTTSDAAGSEV